MEDVSEYFTRKILERDAVSVDHEQGVAPRHERIVERKLAARIAPHGELPFRELQVVLQVAQAKTHHASEFCPIARPVTL